MDSNRLAAPVHAVVALVSVAVALASSGCGEERDAADAPDSTVANRIVPTDSQAVVLSTTEPIRKYNVRSGVVQYSNSRLGAMQTYFFDDYGAREAVYIDSGTTDSLRAPFDVSIYADGWRYDYNTRDSAGIAKFQPNARGPLLGAVVDLRTVQLSPLGRRAVAGLSATGVRYSARGDVSIWMWKGLPLRIEQRLSSGDTIVIEAQSVEVDDTVGIAPFVIPKQIAITRLK